MAEIRRIDEDDELWRSMVAEPKRLPWQIERTQEKEDKMMAALLEIFTSPVEQVKKGVTVCGWIITGIFSSVI